MRFELGSKRLLPRWVVTFFVGGAVILIPWIVLMFTVPQVVNVSRRWELVWGGFDCFLVLGFAVTAFRLITRSPRGAVTAAMTGTMLLIDAWFDVLTTHRGGQVISILMAVFAEIPCALICFYVSRRIVGLFEQAKEVLGSAGFLVRGGQLVPPANFPAPTAPAATAVSALAPVSAQDEASTVAPAFTVASGNASNAVSAPSTAPTISTATSATPSSAGIASAYSSEIPASHDVSSTSIVASRDLAA